MSSAAYRWIRRLARFATFTPEELRTLEDVSAATRRCAVSEDLAKAGDPTDRVIVILEGFACRHKLLPDGRRQILAYLFPGDMGDPRQALQSRVDYSMCVLWPAEIATLTLASIQRLERYANISTAMARYSLMQQAITREWLVNVGHRTALERLGHLLCETFVRLEAVGLTRDHAFELPLTQAELGDTLALSAVHVNRTLMELRRLKLVTFQNRQVVIHDFPALQLAAGFDPSYLANNEKAAS
jgi:CRP-like cAMP-binding protein